MVCHRVAWPCPEGARALRLRLRRPSSSRPLPPWQRRPWRPPRPRAPPPSCCPGTGWCRDCCCGCGCRRRCVSERNRALRVGNYGITSTTRKKGTGTHRKEDVVTDLCLGGVWGQVSWVSRPACMHRPGSYHFGCSWVPCRAVRCRPCRAGGALPTYLDGVDVEEALARGHEAEVDEVRCRGGRRGARSIVCQSVHGRLTFT